MLRARREGERTHLAAAAESQIEMPLLELSVRMEAVQLEDVWDATIGSQ